MLYEIYKPNSLNSDSFNLKIVVLKADIKIRSMLTFKVVRCRCPFSFSLYK